MPLARLLFAIAALAACSDSRNSGPFDGLPLDGVFVGVGVSAPVHVARDQFGVAHISANTLSDAAFVQGYVMAHDRLPQMDILRRVGAGTLAELFGALDPTVIDNDLEMRVHRMRPFAEQTWTQLQASSDAIDEQIVRELEEFARGVNTYVADLRSGKWTLDPEVAVSFDPDRFVDWDPVDSLVLGRFQAFALSYSAPFELDATELYQKLRTAYDVAGNPRNGISRDLMRFKPVGLEPTIPGFPNVTVDTGSRSDGSDTSTRTRAAPATAAVKRPVVPQALFDQARTFFAPGIHNGPFGALGSHAFMFPHAGSNNWAVGPKLAAPVDGRAVALLATDQHLQLPNPSIFYPTHLIVKDADGDPNTPDDALDVLGVTFPGIPGVILGTNGHLAWSATVSEHDVNDAYLESISPCVGGGDCVAWNGGKVEIQQFTEQIQVGALGTITGAQSATYEVVPHHGPIVPTIDRVHHVVVPRTANSALSIRYTGYQPTFEIRALYKLSRAKSVHEGFAALADFTYGSQNWTMIDEVQSIGWTTHAQVPVRKPAAYAWDARANPDGLAPFFVLPGDGSADWVGNLSPRVIPHAIDPDQGYLATANADPVGATFDNLPLNQGVVDGQPLYAGVTYAAGVREERITKLVQDAAAAGVTLDDMARIQHDTHSNVGEKLVPAIRTALATLDSTAGAPPDVAAYLAALPAADRTRLATARTLMTAWTFATPAAAGTDSAATVLFNTWMHFFIERSIKDELDAVSFDVYRLDDNFIVRIVYGLLVEPAGFVLSATTGQPILCDQITTAGPDDSCTKIVLQAMVDAMTHLESPQGFGTADVAQWRWGELHRLKITPLFPNSALDLPAPTDPDPKGFPKAGDNFVINRSDQGWSDLDFSQFADGPAQRFLAISQAPQPGATTANPIKVKWALPGGVIFDSRSPHYRDLLDKYYLPEQHFDAPYSVDEIVGAGESRWVFR